MKVKSIFLREISQNVKILKSDNQQELLEELSSLTTDISEAEYISWILDNFVIGMTSLFNQYLDISLNDTTSISIIKEVLYKEILNLNPKLNPDNLYISKGNTLTFIKDKSLVRLVTCDSWQAQDPNDKIMTLDINDYYKYLENAREFDHFLRAEEWDLFDGLFVSVREFNRKDKINLIRGFIPKSTEEAKYFIVATCIDNFQQLYRYLISDPNFNVVPINKVIDSLYDLSISHNPFLNLKLNEFKSISKKYKIQQKGVTASTDSKDSNVGRKSLSSIPKREVLSLEDTLKKQVFGQDEAIEGISTTIKRAYTGIKNPKTPIGAFFFFGPTSVGKTELAKVLAKSLTKSIGGLVKIPCSTMVSSHNVHTLTGSPPGYVGYEEKGLLEKALESSPFKIILFDEVEKAHSKLFDLVLEMMEEGEVLMANGNVVKLDNCIIIFTSNIGQEEALRAINKAGFSSKIHEESQKDSIIESQYLKTLKEKFKPEFLARLNGAFYFKKLNKENLIKAASTNLTTHIKNLSKKKIYVSYSKDLPEFIISKCIEINKDYHARNIRNYIDMQILPKLGDYMLSLSAKDRDKKCIVMSVKGGMLNFSLKG